MEGEVIQVMQADMLAALNKSEIDIQISTAKAYPREIEKVLNTIRTYAKMDVETAEDCFYALRRSDGDSTKLIEGVSVRMAEIMAGAWGNLRIQARIIGNDGKTITAQGVCHDLETNTAVSVEVKRRITNKYGKTYSEDMQVVTGNAACSIAFRNAVLKVIPKAATKRVLNEVKEVALGKALDLETSRANALTNFAKIQVTEKMICEHLEIGGLSEMKAEDVMYLRSLWNAIKEGDTTVEDSFIKPAEAKKLAAEAKTQSEAAADKVKDAAKKAVTKTTRAAETPNQPKAEPMKPLEPKPIEQIPDNTPPAEPVKPAESLFQTPPKQ